MYVCMYVYAYDRDRGRARERERETDYNLAKSLPQIFRSLYCILKPFRSSRSCSSSWTSLRVPQRFGAMDWLHTRV